MEQMLNIAGFLFFMLYIVAGLIALVALCFVLYDVVKDLKSVLFKKQNKAKKKQFGKSKLI